jgi:hypothetical protein
MIFLPRAGHNGRMNSMEMSVGRLVFRASLAVMAVYLLAMAVLWGLGVESIYQHPTPFYALCLPAFSTPTVPLAVLWITVLASLFITRRAGLRPAGLGALPVLACIAGLAGLAALAAVQMWTAPDGGLSWLAGSLRELSWHIGPLSVFFSFMAVMARSSVPAALAGFGPAPDKAETRRVVTATAVFLFFFACTIAMLRHGMPGISQAYQRETYEYVGDIGKTGSIHDLFARYPQIRPYLSMHAKVHPPGPIALLWVMSWIFTSDPLALSLATAAVGALGVFPLYGWLRACFGARTAMAGVLVYSLVPSIVLFTATSADILFTPFTLTALWGFERSLRAPNRQKLGVESGGENVGQPPPAVRLQSMPGNERRGSPYLLFPGGNWFWYALMGGTAYALATLLSFSLAGVGVYFAVAGLFAIARAESRGAVVRTAAVMLAAFLAVHGLVRLWSGFDYVAALRAGKAQFDLDQHNLDLFTPRYPAWTFRLIFNPAAWFYFAGIPVSLLFLRQLAALLHVGRENRATAGGGYPTFFAAVGPVPENHDPVAGSGPRATVAAFALAAVALNSLYLARGEGERSALYLFPFLVGPAAVALAGMCARARSAEPLWGMLGFLAFQCWVTELFFYTYW